MIRRPPRSTLFPYTNALPISRRRPAVLAVLAPPLDLESAELDQVVRFVRGGGRVVAAGWGGGITSCVGWRLVYPHAFLRGDSLAVASPRPGLSLPAVTNYLRPPRREELDTGNRSRGGDAEACDALGSVAVDTGLHLVGGGPGVLRPRHAAGGRRVVPGGGGYVANPAR